MISKIKIKNFLKTHFPRRTVFIILNSLLSLIIIGFSIYLLIFLITNLNAALSTSQIKSAPILKFDTEGFEKLNLTKP